MPKRPYRPKVKVPRLTPHQGCYECSQRRLNCDRGVPECQKCIKKGVKCSGLGIRHRFCDGVASRVSENIAGEMIAIDGPHNGWRHLVLPIADHDELVMDAVLAVSLFHKPEILQDISLAVRPEEEYYARAIHGLQERSQLRDYNQLTRHSIILAILLLLTAVMVNGSSDFPILFGMLQSAIDAIGGDMELGSGGTAEFLSRQIRKIKVYAAPLLSEQTGIDIISSETEVNKMFECFHHCMENSPQHYHSLELVPVLVRQACDIYLNQVVFNTRTQSTPQIRARRVIESIRRVQRFIDTFEALPENGPGKQVLIWACFIAALDCRLADHKEFFSEFFLKNYARSGFKNLTLGLDALHKLWALESEDRWGLLLPEPKVFVM
ncbi:hypothetical protein DER46DRAFT_628499 [Fusarium sp. MPI-SDFR-AT-0072]|nr:hypothetical protein DER46DRAFT_628499 [Fusarium sp. MPI-SDFR-AT-0072]